MLSLTGNTATSNRALKVFDQILKVLAIIGLALHAIGTGAAAIGLVISFIPGGVIPVALLGTAIAGMSAGGVLLFISFLGICFGTIATAGVFHRESLEIDPKPTTK